MNLYVLLEWIELVLIMNSSVGFKTSSEYNIYATSGHPMEEPRCMMCQETFEGSLKGIEGYVVYDMYYNA